MYSDNVSSEEVEKLGIESIVRKYGDLTLVFPIESVGQEHVTQSPYLDMYSIFRTALKSQTRNRNIWLIIGTSLQDATLCSAMENALAVTPAGEWPEIILLSKSAQESKTSLNPRYNTLKEHLLPLNANIEPGADGFGKFDELLRQLKENNRLKS